MLLVSTPPAAQKVHGNEESVTTVFRFHRKNDPMWLFDDAQFTAIIMGSGDWTEIGLKCGNTLTNNGFLRTQKRKRIIKRVDLLHIPRTHVKNKQNYKHKNKRKLMAFEDLGRNRRYHSDVLSDRLTESGRDYECALCKCEAMTLTDGVCDWTEKPVWYWNGKSMKLHVDHVNGFDGDDADRLQNLRFLCPNCHSQTSNYCGRDTQKAMNKSNAVATVTRGVKKQLKPRQLKPFAELKGKRRCTNLLRRILAEDSRPYVCAWCNCEKMIFTNGGWEWQGKKLTIQVDHINGLDGSDNQDLPENLRWLCPTCHSQTPNHCKKKTKTKTP